MGVCVWALVARCALSMLMRIRRSRKASSWLTIAPPSAYSGRRYFGHVWLRRLQRGCQRVSRKAVGRLSLPPPIRVMHSLRGLRGLRLK